MKDKVVLVTGANGGLGTYVTQALLDAGATVIGLSRKIEQSEFDSPNFIALPAEISTASGAKAAIDSVVAPASASSTFWPTRWVASLEGSRSPTPTTPLSSACSTST